MIRLGKLKASGVLAVALCFLTLIVQGQDDSASQDDPATVSSEEEVFSEEAESSEEADDVSDALRSNLEETIREGEQVLRGLPKERMRITRSRLANLKRQLKRKEKERKDLQESLGMLRADFYRRSAALQRSQGKVDGKILKEKATSLKDDYELHAESFEQELIALDEDVRAIQQTIKDLEERSAVAESLKPTPRVTNESSSEAGETVLKLPQRLNPFDVQSLVSQARGRDYAPRGTLWALQAEIDFNLERLDEARKYWQAALDVPPTSEEQRPAILTNLAYISYRQGDFVTSYNIYSEVVDGKKPEELSVEESYTLAVLSYLNGLVNDARFYLTLTDDARRARMQDILSPAETSEVQA